MLSEEKSTQPISFPESSFRCPHCHWMPYLVILSFRYMVTFILDFAKVSKPLILAVKKQNVSLMDPNHILPSHFNATQLDCNWNFSEYLMRLRLQHPQHFQWGLRAYLKEALLRILYKLNSGPIYTIYSKVLLTGLAQQLGHTGCFTKFRR